MSSYLLMMSSGVLPQHFHYQWLCSWKKKQSFTKHLRVSSFLLEEHKDQYHPILQTECCFFLSRNWVLKWIKFCWYFIWSGAKWNNTMNVPSQGLRRDIMRLRRDFYLSSEVETFFWVNYVQRVELSNYKLLYENPFLYLLKGEGRVRFPEKVMSHYEYINYCHV